MKLEDILQTLSIAEPKEVGSLEGTTPREEYRARYINEDRGTPLVVGDDQVNSLFGASKSYRYYAKESPVHRLMLWMRLEGHNNREIATMTGYCTQTVANVSRQPWFQEAFCRISTERGLDIVDGFLQGEIIPTLDRLVKLRDGAESDAVKKAACDSILDRVRGKPVARVETKVSGSVDTVVYDVAELMKEKARNDEILKSRGIAVTGPN